MSPSPGADLRRALRVSWPVLLGFLPLGMAFGILLASSGLAWWWAPIFSAVIYAGSIEFLAIGLVLSGSPLLQTAVTALAVNFRHVFYALSFPMAKVRSLPAKLYSAYAISDEAYAILAPYRDKPATGRFIVLTQVLCQSYWVAGSTLGAGLGDLIGATLPGLEFILTALFAVLAIEAYRAHPDPVALAAALACGLGSSWLFGGAMLAPALCAYVTFLLVRRGLGRRGAAGATA